MLLDRIEIDNHGPLNRVEIGPLSHHLNVVLGPAGSGKTAISRFIRDSLIDREYPLGMLSNSSGRIVWVGSNGWIHCRREQDGTPGGRRTVEFENRSESPGAWDGYLDGWFDSAEDASQTTSRHRSSLASRTLQSIRIPESIVDGVMIDTTVSSVSRVIASCVSAGLDRDDLARLPFENETARFNHESPIPRNEEDDRRRRERRAELADVEAELAKYHELRPAVHVVDNSELQHQRGDLLRNRDELLVRRQRLLIDPVHPVGLDRVNESVRLIDAEIARLDARLRELDATIAEHASVGVGESSYRVERIEQLQRRREILIAELDRDRPIARRESSLSELASRWLVRLSAGRHRVLQWSSSPVTTDGYTRLPLRGSAALPDGGNNRVDHRVFVSIDRLAEQNVSAATRALACLAIRMAAGQLLDRMGHTIPLVLETHRELLTAHSNHEMGDHTNAYQSWTREGISGDAIASAFSDYTAAGRQLLVLTEYAPLAHQLKRSGARSFELHTQRIVHPHRPIWRGVQRKDHYTGPHGIDADGRPVASPVDLRDTEIDHYVNRAFDQAWIESAGLREGDWHAPVAKGASVATSTSMATDAPAAGATHRDGYYYAQQSSTRPLSPQPMSQRDAVVDGRDPIGPSLASDSLIARHGKSQHSMAAAGDCEVPYFMTVDSPIDTAPSVDALAAQRLRRIGISHITHLMNQDSNRLADTLGLVGVDAKTIRRWQSECRLMCRVPQLRGFDARVLVGCGIQDPAQLAAIHPTDLLDRVKTFLATERGQQILLSGTSYELSRITSWIASANHSVHTVKRTRTVDGQPVETQVTRERVDANREFDHESQPQRRVAEEVYLTDDDFDQERYEVEVERRADRIAEDIDELTRDYDRESAPKRTVAGLKSSSSSQSRTRRNARSSDSDRSRTGSSDSSSSKSSPSASRSNRSNRSARDGERRPRESTRSEREYTRRERQSIRGERDDQPRQNGHGAHASRSGKSRSGEARSSERTLRFYLERADEVVDAPSIGPRMAERLSRIGIDTVDDLLSTDAATIAAKLKHRRVDVETVIHWQQQSTLVCRVPMMRGHDAQFLVAVGVTTPEELAACTPVALFAKVDEIAHSSEGKRIVRGGKLPDLEEVTEWIAFANQNRSLRAA